MKEELVVGEVIKVSKFEFRNKAGGTGLSNWEHNERFRGHSKVKIIKRWDDYETGECGWAVPLETEIDLINYLKRNAKKRKFKGKMIYIIYVGEFDIVGNEY